MANVFYIKWRVLQQHCNNNRTKELCCIWCTFSPCPPPLPNISICLFTPYPVYVVAWTTPHCSLSGDSSMWCIYIYIYIYIHTYSKHLFLSFLSPIVINFSWLKSSLTNWVYWKYSAAESGQCDGKRLKMALWAATSSLLPGSRYDSLVCKKILILTTFSANCIKTYENRSNFSHILWEFTRLFSVYWPGSILVQESSTKIWPVQSEIC